MASVERAALGCAFFVLDVAKPLGLSWRNKSAVSRQSSTTKCDPAFSLNALMWLLACKAAVLQGGPEKS